MFIKLSAPVAVQWELTSWCNHFCIHCYNYWRHGTKNVFEPDLEAYDKVSQAMAANKVFAATLTGGEPLVALDAAFPYLIRLRDAGIVLSMNTNLTLLTPRKVEQLNELGVRAITTSLMSYDPTTNDYLANAPSAFNRVVEGIRLALESGFYLVVNMVVSKHNLAHVFATAEFLKSLGVENFSATKVSTPGNAPEAFDGMRLGMDEFHLMLSELLRVRDELGMNIDSLEFYPYCSLPDQASANAFGGRMCTAGKTACTIGDDGEVRPCSHAPMAYGNLKTDDLWEVWDRQNPWRSGEMLPEKCRTCPAQLMCMGGCKIEALVEYGSLNAPDPLCRGPHLMLPEKPEPAVMTGSFRFRRSIRTRSEDFGGIVFSSTRRWAPVTASLLRFVEKQEAQPFAAVDLAHFLDLSEGEIQPTLNLLLSKGIILPS